DRAGWRLQPFHKSVRVEPGKEQERGNEPASEQQERDACDPLRQPMLTDLARRAETADLAERSGAVADAHFRYPSSQAQRRMVRSRDPTIVRIAEVLFTPSSKPAPVSVTRWRMPESRCWKKLQVRPTSTINPTGLCAALAKAA